MNLIAFLNEMHLTPYSAAAYAIAWLVYLGYLGRILVRMKKVAAERAELERTFASGKTATLTRSAS
ncbi:MAG TPA: hypothetical protein VMD98_05465 [Bryocella sp.]|nr:hypothetical protein [Bryocella sp.]